VDSQNWLVIGLGNVGKRYQATRHNIGFVALERLVAKHGSGGASGPKKLWQHSEVSSVKISGAAVVACWPTTFMNLSGDAAQELAAFYHIQVASHVIVIQDDIDLPPGQLRIRKGGGDGGQKGIRSVIERLGCPDFIRIKIGVGRPADPRFDIADWVLSKFSKEEDVLVAEAVEDAADAVCLMIEKGLIEAQNRFN